MITDSFTLESEAIVSPKAFFSEQRKICDVAIGTFSSRHEFLLQKSINNYKI